MKSQTLTYKIRDNVYFNVDSCSGRWNISKKPSKILDNKSLDKLNEWDNLIRTIVVNVTDSCNLNCVYCSRQCTRKTPGIMKLSLLKKILKKGAKYGILNNICVTIQFHGGEPLIEFDNLIQAIDYLSKEEKNHLKLRIQTNGTLINEKIMKECCKRNIEVGISLDGRKIENDISRNDATESGTFDRIKDALKLIKAFQKEVSCLTVVTNINVDNLDKILEYFDELGLNNIGFLPLYEEPRTRTIKKEIVPDMKILAESQKNLFDKWIEILKSKKNKDLNITTFQILIWNLLASNSSTKKFRVNCGVGVNSFFVEDDGSVWGCGAFSYADELKLGDLNKQSLEDIQRSEAYKKFQKRTTLNTKKCSDCPVQFICRGGCVANGFQKEGNIFETDVWCPYWEQIIKHIIMRIDENPKIINLIPYYNIKK